MGLGFGDGLVEGRGAGYPEEGLTEGLQLRASAAVLVEVPLPSADAVQPYGRGRAGGSGRGEQGRPLRPLWWFADGQAVLAGEGLGVRGADQASRVGDAAGAAGDVAPAGRVRGQGLALAGGAGDAEAVVPVDVGRVQPVHPVIPASPAAHRAGAYSTLAVQSGAQATVQVTARPWARQPCIELSK